MAGELINKDQVNLLLAKDTPDTTNPAADPLRSVLARYGAQAAQTADAGAGPVSAPPPPRSAVQQQQLAPVQRRY